MKTANRRSPQRIGQTAPPDTPPDWAIIHFIPPWQIAPNRPYTCY